MGAHGMVQRRSVRPGICFPLGDLLIQTTRLISSAFCRKRL